MKEKSEARKAKAAAAKAAEAKPAPEEKKNSIMMSKEEQDAFRQF
jgi:hypothetical protein